MTRATSSKRLYVGNLPHSVTEIGLSTKFRECGKVLSIKLIVDRITEISQGFGFVEMNTPAEAKRAIAELDGSDYDGWQLTVRTAMPRR